VQQSARIYGKNLTIFRSAFQPPYDSYPGEDAIIRKDGERLIIEPAPPQSLLALLDTLAPLEEDFPPIPDLAPDSVEL